MKDPVGNTYREGQYVYWMQLGRLCKVIEVYEPHVAGNTNKPHITVQLELEVDTKQPIGFICVPDPTSEKIVDELTKGIVGR